MNDRPLVRLMKRVPWPVRGVLGLVIAGLGVFLITRSLDALTVLTVYLGVTCALVGAGDLVRPSSGGLERIIGVAWIVIGALVLALPGRVVMVLPVVVGVGLILSGLLRVRDREGTHDARIASVLLGLAEAIAGVVALSWPDVTLVIVAALFGVRAVLVGIGLAWDAFVRRDRNSPQRGSHRPGVIHRWFRVVGAVVALAVAVGALSLNSNLRSGRPDVGAFYDSPRSVPSEPGVLVRSEPLTAEVPAGAHAWRILYTTTGADEKPALASGLVLVPDSAGPHDVIAWAHGTTGYARQCAPSVLKKPFTSGAFPEVLDNVVREGWAVVATDYTGLGTEGAQPYLIGRGEAASVLDAVRAARGLDQAEITHRTVVWGHSQGGGAAVWTDQLQLQYAPDVPLLGTAAMAPAADVLSLARNLDGVTGGSVFGSYVLKAYAETYDDVHLTDVIRPTALPFVEQIVTRCLSEPGILASVLSALSLGEQDILRVDPGAGAIGDRLRENVPTDLGPGPLLIAQGEADSLIDPTAQQAYVDRLRAAGHDVDYRVFPGLDHMPLVQQGSDLLPQLMTWTRERFAS